MLFFVIFIFGAVILGAGAMLSPAWPTLQPRVGLAGAFSLAIIIGGTIFLASLFAWNTLVIDYLLFALVVGIFLGGTLSVGQSRAEKRGETLEDVDQGWPGPHDLAFFGMIAVALVLLVVLLGVPFGTSAQGYGFMALVTRDGSTLDTFAPFHPQIEYLYAPGFSALTAYLSQQLNVSIASVQFGVGAVLALLNIWVAYDLGAEIRNKRLGRMMAVAMLASLGVIGMLMQGEYTALLGLIFAQAFLAFVVRWLRYGYAVDAVGAGLMLGAVAISSPGIMIMVLLGYVPWLAIIWLSDPRPTLRSWVVLAFVIPLIAVAAVSPWLADIVDLLRSGLRSPYERSLDHLRVMLVYHGVWVVPVALVGLYFGWLRREPIVMLCIVWLFLMIDFSTSGGLAALFPFITRYSVPFDIAWHGPVIPFTILGGMGLLWLWDTVITPRFGDLTYRQVYVISGLVTVLAVIGFFIVEPERLSREARLVTEDDMAAAEWLRANAPQDARILNYPLWGEWTPALAERDSVFYPVLPYATATTLEEQNALMAFWLDPDNPAHADLLAEAGIDYVLIPAENRAMLVETESVARAPYLEPVFEQGSAHIYAVIADQ
ncbi:MAG: hypothetical protein OHK0046_23410 [Anaerolineae bacterium]